MVKMIHLVIISWFLERQINRFKLLIIQLASDYYPDSKLLSRYPDNTDIRFSPSGDITLVTRTLAIHNMLITC